MSRQLQGSQTDFSSGEIDVDLKRCDDHPTRKTGLRRMLNMRIHNSGTLQNRSGRTALFPTTNTGRTEEVIMSAGNIFKLAFGTNSLKIFNSVGALVTTFATQGSLIPLPWTLPTLGQIVFAQFGSSVYICYPGMRPQVLTWDGVATWTLTDYTELVNGGQKRTLFYRISAHGIQLQPGAQTGAGVSLASDTPLFKPAHVGTRMRFAGRQMLITAVADSLHATVTIMETLPGAQRLTFGVDPRATYSLGDAVIGTSSNSSGVVTATTAATIDVQLLSIATGLGAVAFTTADVVVGPGGGLQPSAVGAVGSPALSAVWDEEVMNTLQGYPASCFVDQFRLGFCNFPTLPGGVAWSAINSPTDMYVVGATQPTGAIFEFCPDKVQVYFVVPGPESSEFVICDRKLYYIKIDVNNPLKPGSVGFQILSSDGCAQVQPRTTQELILYVNAGGNSVMAITAPGAYYRPFNTTNLCDFHSHLFNNIQAIAVPTADGTFNERYAYILNGDGSIAVGKYTLKDGQTGTVGWGPWNGAGVVSWIASFAADVLFTTTYFGTFTVCEVLDDGRYLDCSVLVNKLPAAMAPPPGLGPLWWAINQQVSLMDQVTRSMGVYRVDALGNIIPQGMGGENLAAATLMAGLQWSGMVEPFAPDAQSGTDMHQRMEMRQFSKFAAYVLHSTGLLFVQLFSAKQTRTSPPLGTAMSQRRVPAYNQDDDATLPPPLRETVEFFVPPGSSYDPRAAIIHDIPGPLQILEIAMEISI